MTMMNKGTPFSRYKLFANDNMNYYDQEEQVFVIRLSLRRKTVPLDVVIVCDNGLKWNCYLRSCEYLNVPDGADVYDCRYKIL